jgi:UDP-N-acetylmuramoylalanine--D-glutamate ligase
VRGEEKLIALAELQLVGPSQRGQRPGRTGLVRGDRYRSAGRTAGPGGLYGSAHRVERIAEIKGVRYFDDSKGTNVGATLAAIEGLGCKLAIILGGDGKGQDFSPLRPALDRHARAIALIGRDAPLIAALLAGSQVPLRRCLDMPEAVRWCAAQAQRGDAVLLSPACASMDMYRNYAHRAAAFADAVRGLEGEAA